MKIERGGILPHENIQLISIETGVWCLNDSFNQKQVFGGDCLRDTWEDIANGKVLFNSEIYDCLRRNEFLDDKVDYFSQRKDSFIKKNASKDVCKVNYNLLRLLITDDCNLSCSYCKVVPNVASHKIGVVDDESIRAVVRYFFSNSNVNEPKTIHITGGEPTVYFDKVRRIVAEVESECRINEKYMIVLGTNGTLISQDMAAFFKDHDVKCIVSIDGPEQVHNHQRIKNNGKGSWEDVDSGIRLLKNAGVEVSLSMVLGKHNIGSVEDIIGGLLSAYDPVGLGVNLMKPPSLKKKYYQELVAPEVYAKKIYDIHKKYRSRGLFLELVFRKLQPFVYQRFRLHDCGAGTGSTINLDSRGRVGPCKSFLLMNRIALGIKELDSLRESSFDLWGERSPLNHEECTMCHAVGICGNGCAYDSFVQTGDLTAIDNRNCQYSKLFYRLFLEDLFNQIKPLGQIDKSWVYVPSQSDRMKLLGNVRSYFNTLSYSIGHHTSA